MADVALRFEEILQEEHAPSPYLLETGYGLYLDTLLSATDAGIDTLSRRRGLILTVDGVHLNRRGAEVYARVVGDALSRCLQIQL